MWMLFFLIVRVRALFGTGGKLCVNALLFEGILEALVDGCIDLGEGQLSCRKGGVKNKAISPVITVVDHTAGGGAAREGESLRGELAYFAEALGIAEGECWLCPAIVAEEGVTIGNGLQERAVNRHVFGAAAEGIGKMDELHLLAVLAA